MNKIITSIDTIKLNYPLNYNRTISIGKKLRSHKTQVLKDLDSIGYTVSVNIDKHSNNECIKLNVRHKEDSKHFLLITSSYKKNKKKNINISIDIHLNRYLEKKYPLNVTYNLKEALCSLSDLISKLFMFKFSFDKTTLKQIDIAYDFILEEEPKYYLDIIQHLNFKHLINHRSSFQTISLIRYKNKNNIDKAKDIDKIFCIYDKTNKYITDENIIINDNILRVEYRYFSDHRDRKSPFHKINILELHEVNLKNILYKYINSCIKKSTKKILLRKINKTRKKFVIPYIEYDYTQKEDFSILNNVSNNEYRKSLRYIENKNNDNLNIKLSFFNHIIKKTGYELYKEMHAIVRDYLQSEPKLYIANHIHKSADLSPENQSKYTEPYQGIAQGEIVDLSTCEKAHTAII